MGWCPGAAAQRPWGTAWRRRRRCRSGAQAGDAAGGSGATGCGGRCSAGRRAGSVVRPHAGWGQGECLGAPLCLETAGARVDPAIQQVGPGVCVFLSLPAYPSKSPIPTGGVSWSQDPDDQSVFVLLLCLWVYVP